MKDGVIMQCGSPTEIYVKPQNPFVAGFIGVSNFLDCTVDKGGVVDIKGELKVKVPTKSDYTGPAKLSARPEQLFFSKEGMPGVVQFSTFLGDFIEYEVQLDDGQNLIVNEYTKDTTEVHEDGEKVFLNFDPERISVYKADSEEVITC
jgi:iron(III) transport system ATP-binding protein